MVIRDASRFPCGEVVYFDIDMLFLKRVDDLFERDELSAVPDSHPPDRFNSGIFVAKPSLKTLEDMKSRVATVPSYNLGDQGFLNGYFADWYTGDSSRHLPYEYNAFTRDVGFTFWASREAGIKVLHFTGESKPWNHMEDVFAKQHGRKGFNEKYNEMWHAAHDAAVQKMMCGDSHEAQGAATGAGAVAGASSSSGGRQPRALSTTGATLIINAFDRPVTLAKTIEHYSRFANIHKIVVNWGNTAVPAPKPADLLPGGGKLLEVQYMQRDWLTDRFLPTAAIETQVVAVSDDDIQITESQFDLAMEQWRGNQQKLVGMFPRALEPKDEGGFEYKVGPKTRYSLLLTKFMLVNFDHLRAFTCGMPAPLMTYLNTNKNCEDIAMNVFVASRNADAVPPIYVSDPEKVDYGRSNGLSIRPTHDDSRATCFEEIWKALGSPTIKYSDVAVVNKTHTAEHFADHRDVFIKAEALDFTSKSWNYNPPVEEQNRVFSRKCLLLKSARATAAARDGEHSHGVENLERMMVAECAYKPDEGGGVIKKKSIKKAIKL